MQCKRSLFDSWDRKIPWRRDRLPTPVFLGFSGGSDGKESACNAGDLGSIPGLGRYSGGGHGNSLQYSCLENPHGQSCLAGYGPGDGKESDMTEWLSITQHGPESSSSVWENNFSPLYFSGHFTILFVSKFFKVVEINQFGERNREKQRSKNTRKVTVFKVWEKNVHTWWTWV